MKKLLAMLLMGLLIATPVFAEENVVSIVETDDGKIVYNAADGFNERFMVHEGMVPGGETYTDYLTVKNDTSKGYEVFFKITSENNSAKASNLIDHIEMKIYIDDNLFYDGKARGLDYRSQGIDLTDAVLIQYFDPGQSVTMKIETYLDTAYSDIDNPDTSRTHWHFYITDGTEPDPDDPITPDEVPPNPHTEDDFSPLFIILLGASIALFIFITIREYAEKSKRSRD